MPIISKKEAILLFSGDIFFFLLALWITLFLRDFSVPNAGIFYNHFEPFALLFIAWILVFFISGLYEKHTILFKRKLPSVIVNAQITNVIIAALFFFLIPYFGITPKTTLAIYLLISSLLIIGWRLYMFPQIRPRRKEKAALIGKGYELEELIHEVNENPRYNLEFVGVVNLDDVADTRLLQNEIRQHIDNGNITTVVADTRNEQLDPLLSLFYDQSYRKRRLKFVDMYRVYEGIFSRVPLSLLHYSWILENISSSPKVIYDVLKRVMDIVISIAVGVVSLIVYPFVWLAIKIEDGGPLFSCQDRVGKNNQNVRLIKFRTMAFDDQGQWDTKGKENYVTKVGAFLRTTRIDELPQLWNVLTGSVSLIGPRPEFPQAVAHYIEQIPHYNVRHLIKPGLSGWAQIYHENHPHHGTGVEQTREKLSYDLYYIKNRSLMLDIQIALKTIKTFLSRSGV